MDDDLSPQMVTKILTTFYGMNYDYDLGIQRDNWS